MLSFTLKHCEYFEAVATHGGIAQAARELGISQPAVAQGLDRLEERTGLVLFHRRHARGAELTIQGRALRESVQQLLMMASELEQKAAGLSRNVSGRLRLGCFHTLAPFCIASLVRGYTRMRPDATLEPFEMRHEDLVTGLTDGSLDLAIMYDMSLEHSGLVLTPLTSLSPRILIAADHPLATRETIALAQLADEPFVLFEGAGSSDYFRGIIAARGIDPPVAIRCQSMESVRSAVANGLGFSFTSMRTASGVSHDGQAYVERPIADAVTPLDIVVGCTPEMAGSALMADFIEFCGALFRRIT